MLKSFVASCSFLFLVLAAVTASAQTDDVRSSAHGHVGPLYFTPTFEFKDVGVDNNVFNQSGELKKPDFTLTIAPKLDVWAPVASRALFAASTSTDVVWYAKYASERSIDPQVSVRSEIYLNRLTLLAEGSYANTRARPNYEIDLRSRHVQNGATAGLRYALTRKLSFDLSANRGLLRFDGDAFFRGQRLEETLNRETEGLGLIARWKTTALTTFVGQVEKFRDRFQLLPERDSESVRVTFGADLAARALISGKFRVGVRDFKPTSLASIPPYRGIVANAEVGYTWLGSTAFRVKVSRDIQYSFEQLEPYFLANGLGASIRRALSLRFDVIASADRFRYDYRDLLGTQLFTPERRVDTTWNHSLSIGYRPNRLTRIGIGASYNTRRSNTQDFRAFDGLRLGAAVTYGN